MSMDWAVPTGTMKDVDRQKAKWDKGEEERERLHRLKYCPECEKVFKKADFIYKRFRDIEEECYEKGSMPTIGLDRKICLSCKNDT